MCEKYSRAKEFLIIISKSKSSLHGLTSSDFSPTTDTCNDFCHFSISNVRFAFSKTGKTRVSHRVKMMTRWPGRERWPRWPLDPVTQWPSSMCGVCGRWQAALTETQQTSSRCVLCSCASGPVCLDATLDRSAYCCGEFIRLRCDVVNGTDQAVTLTCRLIQVTHSPTIRYEMLF